MSAPTPLSAREDTRPYTSSDYIRESSFHSPEIPHSADEQQRHHAEAGYICARGTPARHVFVAAKKNYGNREKRLPLQRGSLIIARINAVRGALTNYKS
jgi:hypothetical protein